MKKETESIFAKAPRTPTMEVPKSDIEMKENSLEENKDVDMKEE